MQGQHGSKYFTVVVAVLLLFRSALTTLAQAQGAVAASAVPTAIGTAAPRLSPGPAAIPTPTATARALPAATATVGAGAAASAPVSKIDHALWVSNAPAPSRIDHVLVIQARPSPSPAGAGMVSSIPQAASRPEARQSPGLTTGQLPSSPAPAAQAQPVAMRTPAAFNVAVNHVPQPAATPRLSQIDHVLMVSVHPPGAPGSAGAIDHSFPLSDHQRLIGHRWINGPGHEMLVALQLPPGHHLTEGEELLDETPDDSCHNPMSWSVMVHKSAYHLDVLYKGRYFATFPAVFGRNPDHSAKLYEGDLKTPEGVYTIIEKYYNPRWRWFMRLNYPNYDDRNRYESMLNEGLVPIIWGHPRHLGGAIGIHGTDRPQFNRLHVNWTLGCISTDNDAIDELERILPVGTMVIIEK